MKRHAGLLVAALLTVPLLSPVDVSASQPKTVTLSESQNGKTVTLHAGQHIRVVLHSTYWTIDTAHGKALTTSGKQTTKGTGAPCRPPGSGCGTASRTFLAARPGTGTLTASRTSCGEALRCTGSQGKYRVSIRVVR
jgi:hypothetical protein